MTLSERTRLVDYGTVHSSRFQLFFNRVQWRQVCIPLFCLVPFILWIGVIQKYDGSPGPTPVLQSDRAPITEINPTKPIENGSSKTNNAGALNGQVAEFELVVTSGTLAPDNFVQESYLINGRFPGPTLRVKQNATLIVHVINRLTTNSITIHFHGIHQRTTFLSDGVPNVTQKPILPGQSFTYTIHTWPQTGTFFYHAHTGMDIVSLFGAVVIEDNPEIYRTWPAAYQYDLDKVFTLSGIYHEDLNSIVEDIVGPVHNYPRNVESVAFNGKSYGVWNSTNNASLDHPTGAGYEVISVKKGLRYRFRFINAASDSILLCNISAHSFTVIEMDGIYTVPVDTDQLLISPGQRYSLIIDMSQVGGNYEITCKHTDTYGPKNGLAILSYKGGNYPSKKLRQQDMGRDKEMLPLSRWVLDQLSPNYALVQEDVYALPPEVDQEFMVDVDEVFNGTRNYYVVNGHRFVEPDTPYYVQLAQKVNISDPPQVFEIKSGQSVQFIFQNRLRGSGETSACFSHPWHIHGHTFYVVGEGPDLYDPVLDGARIKEDTRAGSEKRFQFRDTITLFANQSGGLEGKDTTLSAPCGWTVVRFRANNPGLWFSHCHVTPHLLMGKKFVIWEHSDQDPFLTALT